MKKHGLVLILGLIVAAILLANMVTYQVKFTEAALVETFGRLSTSSGSGLHFKWPWPIQRVVTYDLRTQHFEDIHEASFTNDKIELLATVYVCWKVQDPVKFRTSVGDELKVGESYLRDIVRNAKKDIIGKHRLQEFVSTTPGEMKMGQIEQEIFEQVSSRAAQNYGILVQQVGIKRLALPESVTVTVLDNMRKDRERIAQQSRSQGTADALDITSDADSIANEILSFAKLKAAEIRAKGAAEASQYYQSYKGNEAFAMFLRRLDFLSETLKVNSVFLLDGSTEQSFGYFSHPPVAQELGKAPAAPELSKTDAGK